MSSRQKEQGSSANQRGTGRSMLQVLMEWEEKSQSLPALLCEVSAPPCLFCSYQHWFAAFRGIYAINTYASFQNSLAGLHCKQCCSLMFPASILVALQNLQQIPFFWDPLSQGPLALSSRRAEGLWFQTHLLDAMGKSRKVTRETEHLANVYWTFHNKPISSGGPSLWQPNSTKTRH